MPEPLLEARGIVKSFGRVRALRGANFAVYPNEVVALVGDNGAGKSTLVKMLSGVHQPDAGEILFEGQPVEIHSPLDARAPGHRDRLPGPRAGGRARRRRQHVPRPRGDAPGPARPARLHRQAGDARPEPRRVQEPRRRAAGHRGAGGDDVGRPAPGDRGLARGDLGVEGRLHGRADRRARRRPDAQRARPHPARARAGPLGRAHQPQHARGLRGGRPHRGPAPRARAWRASSAATCRWRTSSAP